MTLHDAIGKVLMEAGHPMSAQEIAAQINELKLYRRKDDLPVPAAQIEARVANYSDYFSVENGNIFFSNYNKDLGLEEQIILESKNIRNYLASGLFLKEEVFFGLLLHFLNPLNTKGLSRNSLYDYLQENREHIGKFELRVEEIEHFLETVIRTISNLVDQHSDRGRAVKILCNQFLSVHRGFKYRELPVSVEKLIKAKIVSRDITYIDIVDDLIPLYLLDVLDHQKEYFVQFSNRDNRTKKLSSLIIHAAGLNVNIAVEAVNTKFELGICIPPFVGRSERSNWDLELNAVLQQRHRLISTALQVFVGTTSVLYQRGHKGEMRKHILRDYKPSGIFIVPYKSAFTSISSLSFIEFDGSMNSNEILIGEFTDALKEDEIQSIIASRKEIDGITRLISTKEIGYNDNVWTPARYLVSPIIDEVEFINSVELHEVVETLRGRNLNRKALYPEGEIKYITTKDLSKESDYFIIQDSVLAIDSDEITDNIPRLDKNDVLVTLIGSDLKPNIFSDDSAAIVDQNIIILRCSDKILPEFLVHSLRSELCLKQVNAFRQQGTGIARITRSNLLSIRISLPSLDEQRKILLEHRSPLIVEAENKLDSEEFNFIATLKHTLKQPLTTLSEDFKVLQSFLQQKSKEGLLSVEEIIVPVFEGEDKKSLAKHSLQATLLRCQRMINDAHDHLNKAEQLLRLDIQKPKFELLSIRTLLLSLEKDYPNIHFEFKGRDYELMIDAYSFKIMMDNFIENANKHGFIDIKNPKVLFKTELEKDKFDTEMVCIQYLNNGEPLSEEITTEKFLRKNSKSKKSAGDGYGGHLIHKIIEMHKGEIEIDNVTADKALDYNVCFNIYLPKN